MTNLIREIKEHAVESLFILWITVVVIQYIISYYGDLIFGGSSALFLHKIDFTTVYVLMIIAIITNLSLNLLRKYQK